MLSCECEYNEGFTLRVINQNSPKIAQSEPYSFIIYLEKL